MKTEKIISKINSIPGGRFFRIRYMTKLRTTAEAESNGVSIIKIVDTTTRTGVNYMNIKDSNPSHSEHERTNNWEWKSKNRIKYNTNTEKSYITLAPLKKGHNTKVTYILTDKEGNTSIIDKETAKEYTIKSIWKEDASAITIMNITLDNILHIF